MGRGGILRDGDGRQQVIPRDHHHADAGAPGRHHGVRHAVAFGVDGGHEAHEAQLLAAGLELLVRGDVVVALVVPGAKGFSESRAVARQLGHGPRRDGQHPEGPCGVAVHDL